MNSGYVVSGVVWYWNVKKSKKGYTRAVVNIFGMMMEGKEAERCDTNYIDSSCSNYPNLPSTNEKETSPWLNQISFLDTPSEIIKIKIDRLLQLFSEFIGISNHNVEISVKINQGADFT